MSQIAATYQQIALSLFNLSSQFSRRERVTRSREDAARGDHTEQHCWNEGLAGRKNSDYIFISPLGSDTIMMS